MQLKRVLCEDVLQSPKKRIRISSNSRADFQKPSEFVTAVFLDGGFCKDDIIKRAGLKHTIPTPRMIEAYTMEISTAVREGDLDTLKRLHESGADLDCCNRFGDSLVHIACRHGHLNIVKFLIYEVEASAHVVDDLLRTALHDACWSSKLNFEIIEIIVRAAPENLLWPDKRGHTPFDYARQSDWQKWMNFLTKYKSLLTIEK